MTMNITNCWGVQETESKQEADIYAAMLDKMQRGTYCPHVQGTCVPECMYLHKAEVSKTSTSATGNSHKDGATYEVQPPVCGLKVDFEKLTVSIYRFSEILKDLIGELHQVGEYEN
jgi:hypothetical protein